MFRHYEIAALGLLVSLLVVSDAAEPTVEKKAPQAFRISIPAEDGTSEEKPPFFRVFPGGKDRTDQDAAGSLKTLKFARGESKLYREEDEKPGLIVVLRRIVFIPLANEDYKAILEGEYNAVESRIKKETMQKLFRGEKTDVVFEAETTKGFRPVAFRVKAKTTLGLALEDGKLLIYGGEGNSTITHYALTGDYRYESQPVDLGRAADAKPVYIGWPVKPVLKSDGSPESLPILN